MEARNEGKMKALENERKWKTIVERTVRTETEEEKQNTVHNIYQGALLTYDACVLSSLDADLGIVWCVSCHGGFDKLD